MAYHRLGEFERAIEDLDEVIRLDSQLAKTYDNLDLAFDALEPYRRAMEDFDEAIIPNPPFAQDYGIRAIARDRLG